MISLTPCQTDIEVYTILCPVCDGERVEPQGDTEVWDCCRCGTEFHVRYDE